jgi:hypothetical protein
VAPRDNRPFEPPSLFRDRGLSGRFFCGNFMYIEENSFHIDPWKKKLLDVCPGLQHVSNRPDEDDVATWFQLTYYMSHTEALLSANNLCMWVQGQQFLDEHAKAPEKGWRQGKESF